jgi:Family of unknown function (DUF6776)
MNNVVILRLSLKQRLVMLASSVFLLIMSFTFGYYFSENDFLAKIGNEHSLKKSCRLLKNEYDQLLEEKYRHENNLIVERKTNLLLKKKLTDLTADITQFKAELSFYKGIVNDSANNLGIYFRKILIEAANAKQILEKQPNHQSYDIYNLSITVARKIKNKTYRRGYVEIVVLDQKNNPINNWKIMNSKGKIIKKVKTRFQYFAKLDNFLLIKKQQSINKVQFSFIDSIKGDLDISQEIDWEADKDMNYVGQ